MGDFAHKFLGVGEEIGGGDWWQSCWLVKEFGKGRVLLLKGVRMRRNSTRIEQSNNERLSSLFP